jgi:adenosylcobinamide kinase/adenosylcobinamide-phosphate guanylyltransferase
MKELILGGARSGKSALAQQRGKESNLQVVFIATAQPLDEEMAERIARHRQERPKTWQVVEEPLYLAAALQEHTTPNSLLLVDCLTLWFSNLLVAGDDCLHREKAAFLNILPSLLGDVILVSNEVGQGIVPNHETSRYFRDEMGTLHQQLAQICERVTLVVAGLPLILKNLS